jgi:hypothetical protein
MYDDFAHFALPLSRHEQGLAQSSSSWYLQLMRKYFKLGNPVLPPVLVFDSRMEYPPDLGGWNVSAKAPPTWRRGVSLVVDVFLGMSVYDHLTSALPAELPSLAQHTASGPFSPSSVCSFSTGPSGSLVRSTVAPGVSNLC